jgi:hypothetical protein
VRESVSRNRATAVRASHLSTTQEVVDAAIDVAVIETPMTFGVSGVRSVDADMQAVPRALSGISCPGSMDDVRVVFSVFDAMRFPFRIRVERGAVSSNLANLSRSPFDAMLHISGALSKVTAALRSNLARVLSSNSKKSAVNSSSSLNQTRLTVFPFNSGYSIPL